MNSNDTAKKVLELAREIFPTEVDKTSSMENHEEWDSLNHIQFLFAIEEEFSIKFEPEELSKLTAISSIVSAISKRSHEA